MTILWRKNVKYIPLADWLIGGGDGNGFKSVTAFYPSEASNSNGIYNCLLPHICNNYLEIIQRYIRFQMYLSVSVVITGLGADFTKLESFGKVDAFAENLVCS